MPKFGKRRSGEWGVGVEYAPPMKKSLLAITLLFSMTSIGRSADLEATVLFDGKSLDAWEFAPGAWEIEEDGSLVCRMESSEGDDGTVKTRSMGYIWTKADFVTGMERTLIAKTTGPQLNDHIWSVAFVNGPSLRFRLQTGGTTSELSTGPSSLFGGVWYHIVATYDGVTMRVVLNGALMASAPKSGSIGLHPQSPASIGALSTGTQPYSGWIDDVRIYDRALTDNEILELLFGSMYTSINEAQGPITLSDLLRNPAPTDRIVVRDMLGRMELSGNTGASAPIDLSSLSAGIHMVCLEGRDGFRSARVFVP